MSKKNYYAVAVGKKPGIYEDWYGGAFEQVDKFPGAVHKGFYYKEDAEKWLENMRNENTPQTEPKHKQNKIFFDADEYEKEFGEPPF